MLDSTSAGINEGMEQPFPELMPLVSSEGTFRSDEAITFDDTFVDEILSTKPMRRLGQIGFLGAIDMIRHGTGRSPHRRRHNRLEHTIGVAHLADVYARAAELPERRRHLLLAAALLHDVGHGPLSHTLEPVFAEAFGIDHHTATRQIVRGETPAGEAIREVLRTKHLDPDEVLAMIDGHHDGPDAFLFAGAINLDTLDGIVRCRAFMEPRSAPRGMYGAVRRWARSGEIPESDFDAFWSLKHDVYALLIGGARGRLLDAVAQAYMRSNLDAFEASDFGLTEVGLRRQHRPLFECLHLIASGRLPERSLLPADWLAQEVTIRDRSFIVRKERNQRIVTSIDERYTQTKRTRRVRLDELVKFL